LSVYGFENVSKAADSGIAEKILVHENFKPRLFRVKCSNCQNFRVFLKSDASQAEEYICEKCGGKMHSEEEESIIDYFEEKASATSSEVVVISSDTEEGRMFLKLSGIGAILRYKP
jgi:peptide subunit release factor 1 (eRF1)